MGISTKFWLVTAIALVVIGIIVFAVIMSGYNWDFSELSTVEYEKNTFEIDEEFDSISINTDTSDIIFVISDDVCKVECYEQKKVKHSAKVIEGRLNIDVTDNREWYEYIGINFGSPKITVYLPHNEYISLVIKESTGKIEIPKDCKFEEVDISLSTGDVNFLASAKDLVKIKTSTGNIYAENISAGALELSASTGKITVLNATCEGDIKINVSTGKISLSDAVCKSLISNGSTGDILLKNVIANEEFSIKRSTGNVRFDGSDAAEICVVTDTGDVTGALLTDKVFITKTDTGSIDVPKTVSGGKCEIITDTGDIRINIK